jgi:hypothetical protein
MNGDDEDGNATELETVRCWNCNTPNHLRQTTLMPVTGRSMKKESTYMEECKRAIPRTVI